MIRRSMFELKKAAIHNGWMLSLVEKQYDIIKTYCYIETSDTKATEQARRRLIAYDTLVYMAGSKPSPIQPQIAPEDVPVLLAEPPKTPQLELDDMFPLNVTDEVSC